MFQGTKHVGEDKHFEYLQKAGASNVNGSTSADRTNYFEVVPSNQLELALWLESDRMGFLLDRPGFRETLDNQRDVVKNERRQRVENRPMGLVSQVQLEALYPPAHPYHHEVIGSMEDLSAASVDDVKSFFRTYYAPGNATLVIAGDFDRAQAEGAGREVLRADPRRDASPRGARWPPTRPRWARRSASRWRRRCSSRSSSSSYLTPPSFAPGDRELDLIASVLANGKSSRLYKRLVYDMKIAQSVTRVAGEPEAVEQLRDLGLAHAGPHARRAAGGHRRGGRQAAHASRSTPRELERAKNQIESDTVRSLEPLLARAERLQSYNYLPGDPGYLGEDLRRYRAVDAAAIQRAAEQYLGKDARVIVTVEPNPDAPIMGRVKK